MMISSGGRRARHDRAARIASPATGRESGVTLVIALAMMLIVGVVVSAILAYATTSERSVTAFRSERDRRYAGDVATNDAINWAANTPTTGRDPNLALPTETNCLYTQPMVISGVSQKVKVSCKADAGGDSGGPADVGRITPEALVLLSDRTYSGTLTGAKEPADANGAFNPRPCTGTQSTIGEYGALLSFASGTGNSGSCATVTRTTSSNFKVNGDVAAVTSIRRPSSNGTSSDFPNFTATTNGGKAYCGDNAANNTNCSAMANRTGQPGVAKATDPGRSNPNAPAQNPTDINTAFSSVGFAADGSARSPLVARTTTAGCAATSSCAAFTFDRSTATLTPIIPTTTPVTCPATTIVFLPGWYKSAQTLNQFTTSTSPSCKNVTFWFAPDPGTDQKLLTTDDATGAYYLDFRSGAGISTTPCHNTADSSTRWCIGGAADQNPRVIVGTPNSVGASGPVAAFPNPVNASGTSSDDRKAKADCNPTEAGGQLIFGGESHVYVADGSLEVCAGPFPLATGDAAANHQSIGVWAMPSVAEVSPIPTTSSSCTSDQGNNSAIPGCGVSFSRNATDDNNHGNDMNHIDNPGNIAAIDGKQATLDTLSSCFFCNGKDPWADINMSSYSAPPGYRIQKITARIAYTYDNCADGIGNGCSNPWLDTPGCSDVSLPQGTQGTELEVADLRTSLVLYDDASTGNSAKNCIGVSASGTTLPTGSVRWHVGKNSINLGTFSGYNEGLDGLEYQVTLAPLSSTSASVIPQSGCIVAHATYNAGVDQPDCALIKVNTSDPVDNVNNPSLAVKEAQWRGRFNVQGTVYAPSSAVEVDDTDVAYPLVTRGAVLRTLRVSGYAFRSGYDGTAIDDTIQTDPKPREATFTACIQVTSADGDPCDVGSGRDRILTRARVLFDDVAKTTSLKWWADGASGTDH